MPEVHYRLLNHILFYLLRKEGCPDIKVLTRDHCYNLKEFFVRESGISIQHESIDCHGIPFALLHVRMRGLSSQRNMVALAADGRVVQLKALPEELHLQVPLSDDEGAFAYYLFVTSEYLDRCVNNERTAFYFASPDLTGTQADLFEDQLTEKELSFSLHQAALRYLKEFLGEDERLRRERLERVFKEHPYYKFLENTAYHDNLLNFSSTASDAEIELHLHRVKTDYEHDLRSQEQFLRGLPLTTAEDFDKYQRLMSEYLSAASEMNKSHLAQYVVHRKVILEMLKKAISLNPDGTFSRESMVHNLLMPMKKPALNLQWRKAISGLLMSVWYLMITSPPIFL